MKTVSQLRVELKQAQEARDFKRVAEIMQEMQQAVASAKQQREENQDQPIELEKLIGDLGLFFHSAGKEANIILGGGVLAFAISIWQAARAPLSAYALMSVALPLMFWGAYKAWAKEHSLLEQEQERNSKPDFSSGSGVEILYLADSAPFEEVLGSDEALQRIYTHRFVMRVTVANGRPPSSSVRTFNLIVAEEAGGHTLEPIVPIERHFELIALGATLGRKIGPEEMPFLMDAIRGKMFEQGYHETGWLGFGLQGCMLPAEQLGFELKIIDGYGTEHDVSFKSVAYEMAVYQPSQRV
jgi:hypothetical protein